MRRVRQVTVVIIMTVMMICGGLTVYATEPEEGMSEWEIAEADLEQMACSMAVESNGWPGWPQGPATYGEAAIVMEAGTGAVLYAKNIDAHYFPASITKVLTTLVALKNGELTDTVSVSHDSVDFLQWDEASIGLKEGDKLPLEEALHAVLMASANEAAYAVGESVGINAGHDYNWFIEQMNETCRELGGENSHFANTNGLHNDEHYTCARDMALIGREIFKYPDFFRIAQTLNYKIPATSTCEEHVFQQNHQMLLPEHFNYYEYAVGGKTGFTSEALSTLITMADNSDMQLVCVVLKTYGVHVYPDTRGLFDYAYQNFSKVKIEGREKSGDVGKIIEEDQGGYVVLPESVKFDDLDMKLEPDKDNGKEADLIYTYQGNIVGRARAELSSEYLKRHSADIKKTAENKEGKNDTAGADQDKAGKKDKAMVLAAGSLALAILVLSFYVLSVRRKREAKRRRKAKERQRRQRRSKNRRS